MIIYSNIVFCIARVYKSAFGKLRLTFVIRYYYYQNYLFPLTYYLRPPFPPLFSWTVR